MTKDKPEVRLKMEVELPFRRGRGHAWTGRTIVIEKEEVVNSKESKTLNQEFDVNFFVHWREGDSRDKAILAGKERQQNVCVDVRRVLIALQRMFPELNVTFDPLEKSD